MAAYFRLYPVGSKEPAIFQRIDDQMREDFNEPADAENWYRGWYDLIGFALAVGKTWDECRELFPGMVDIIDWLEERYTVSAWMGR